MSERAGGERSPEPRIVRELSDRPFALTRLVELDGRRWVHKRFRVPTALPLAPLARALMRHELRNCRRLEGVDGAAWNAVPFDGDSFLREWVEGTDLRTHRRRGGGVPDGFFDALRATLDCVHARGLAYNDLERRENVLITPSGSPVLIDYQISLRSYGGRSRLLRSASRWAIRQLQRQDLRYFAKMKARLRPDLLTEEERARLLPRNALSRAYYPLWRALHALKRALVPKGGSSFRFSRRPRRRNGA